MRIEPTILGIGISIFFGLLPDFDALILLPGIIKGDKTKIQGTEFKHHEFPTHFPLLYSPSIVVAIFLPNIYTFTIVAVIYLHFFTDTFYTSDGIKWLYPFKKTFYSLKSAATMGKNGIFWEQEYVKTPMLKMEYGMLISAALIMWLNHIFYYGAPAWGVALLGGVIISFLVTAVFIERARIKHLNKTIAEEKKRSI